jgi:hypothetical protein
MASEAIKFVGGVCTATVCTAGTVVWAMLGPGGPAGYLAVAALLVAVVAFVVGAQECTDRSDEPRIPAHDQLATNNRHLARGHRDRVGVR